MNRQGCRSLLFILISVVLPANQTAQAESPQNEIQDLHYGETLFHFYQGKYFSALSDLLIAEKKHPIKGHGHDPQLLLGGLYLSYGMQKPATEVFLNLAQENRQSATHDATWYYLAKLAYQKNDLDAAVSAIEKVTHYLPYRYNDEYQHLKANIYLRRHQYDDAVKVLQNFSGETVWSSYAKYNLAVALIKSGQTDEGLKLLNKAAEDKATTTEQLVLRDKANMALGFASLKNNAPPIAMSYFNRIQLLGYQSNKALLGTGWALYKTGDINKALVPWLELQNRASSDPAVQEALITIPYALEQLNDAQQALSFYNDAINTYDIELTAINNVIDAVQSGEFTQAIRTRYGQQQAEEHLLLANLPDSIATPYLQQLIASHDFQGILASYRDTLYMRETLAHWDRQVPSYQLMLDERELSYNNKTKKVTASVHKEKIARLQQQYQSLKNKLTLLTTEQDVFALASEPENKLLHRLDKVKQRLDKLPATDDFAKQHSQYRLFKGLIDWQISVDYSPRQWQIQKGLQQIRQALLTLEQQNKSIENALTKTPNHFSTYKTDITQKQEKIAALNKRIDRLIKSQEAQFTQMAQAVLASQKNRLEKYHIRASYALTRLYDSLAKAEQ